MNEQDRRELALAIARFAMCREDCRVEVRQDAFPGLLVLVHERPDRGITVLSRTIPEKWFAPPLGSGWVEVHQRHWAIALRDDHALWYSEGHDRRHALLIVDGGAA